MARQLRLHVPGGFYHVTLRGNHRQAIFFRDQDRDLLDGTVAAVIAAHGARVHAFCWMTNHVHMLIQISDVPLGSTVLCIASRYARTVQLRLSTTGHLFERRYHCVLVDADSYLLTLIRYIHLNPVRAGLAADPASYRWSSHRAYLGNTDPKWVTTSLAMGLLAHDPDAALKRYLQFMGESESCQWGTGMLAPNRSNSQILGGDEFAARVAARQWKPRSRKTLDELVIECSKRFGVSPELLSSPRKYRKLAAARAWVAHEAIAGQIASICGVARRFARSESSIRELMSRYPHESANA